jgi:L-seryl-tRNA(Ser) seleniumtransferase
MIAATTDDLLVRAAGVLAAMPETIPDRIEIASMTSAVGGGSLPGETLGSVGLVVSGGRPAALAARLRTGDPPVIGRVEGDAVLLDLRTIDPADDEALGGALARALGAAATSG